jgi:hypothetical protein
MKRIIKSIAASTLPTGVKYLLGDPDAEDILLEGYGEGYKVIPYEDIIEDMVSGIKTDDMLIRVTDRQSQMENYVVASKSGRRFGSYEYAFNDILDMLPIKELPEYDSISKTIYTTYGRSWSYAVDCAELPKDVYDGWIDQLFDLNESSLQAWLDVGFAVASEEEMNEFLIEMLEQNNHTEELSPNPKDLF